MGGGGLVFALQLAGVAALRVAGRDIKDDDQAAGMPGCHGAAVWRGQQPLHGCARELVALQRWDCPVGHAQDVAVGMAEQRVARQRACAGDVGCHAAMVALGPTHCVGVVQKLVIFQGAAMTTTRKRISRTVFDLSPQELHALRQHNIHVSATVPPKRPSRSAGYDNHSDYAFDYGIFEKYRDLHWRAKCERSEWLKAQRITHKVAAQAALARYRPYARAAMLGLVAPVMPEGYAQAHAALFAPKPRPAPVRETQTIPGLPSVQTLSF